MSASGDRLREEFEGCFGQPGEIGRDPAGGWTRLTWTGEDREARAWFEAEAGRPRPHRRARPGRQPLGLVARPGPRELRTGGGGRSHLDTVAGGGAHDGTLGVVSGLLAVGS